VLSEHAEVARGEDVALVRSEPVESRRLLVVGDQSALAKLVEHAERELSIGTTWWWVSGCR
jgi:hypothetical protein